MAMRRFQMYVTQKQFERLEALLGEEESIAMLVRKAVDEFLAREEAKRPSESTDPRR